MAFNLKNRTHRIERQLAQVQSRLERNMGQRLTLGLSLFTLIIVIAAKPEWKYLGLVFILGTGILITLVVQTKKLRSYQQKLKNWMSFLQRQDLRRQGLYTESPHFDPYLDESNDAILAKDLNLFGPHSLFHLLDECFSDGGKKLLSQTLVEPKLTYAQIRQRQQQVKLLAKFNWPLTKLRILGQQQGQSISTTTLVEDLKSSVLGDKFRAYAIGHALLYPLAWGLTVAAATGAIGFPVWIPLTVYLVFALASRSEIELGFTKAQSYANNLQALLPVFRLLEGQLNDPVFEELLPNIKKTRATRFLKRLDRLIAFLSVQGHPIAYVLVNVLFPWDYTFTYLVESWRRQFGRVISPMLAEVNHLEVLSSFGFFYYFQTQTLPEFGDKPHLEFEQLRHPLLPVEQAVANSFSLPVDKNLILITGSNMSGKSTFLRTVGVNQQLALMGCPVFAQSFKSFVAPIKTCLQISDSLAAGYSTFYYEVKRVAEIITSAKKGESFIYLVDEIFRGTNNRERLAGSQAVVKELLNHLQILGIITTHDLELTTLEKNFQTLGNWHFRDDIEKNELSFSYKIHQGPCPSTNALKIMAAEGLPVPT